jgi:hypothetical protein
MLHENPLMADIDVDHWRNMQELLLESAKVKRRIILIHENGEVQKFVHSHGLDFAKAVTQVDDPVAVAEKIYRSNQDKADFVMVLERKAVENYFAKVQDTWDADEDLDVYVHRMFATLDEYPAGIVTFPGKARTNLGLQWRVGATYEDVTAAIQHFVPANSTIIFGVFLDGYLWASLVLGFDEHKKIYNITTADPSEIALSGNWAAMSKQLVSWVNKKFSPCSLGLFTDAASIRDFLRSQDKLSVLQKLSGAGKLIADPLPKALSSFLQG